MLSRRDFAIGAGASLLPLHALAQDESEKPVMVDADRDRDDRLTIPVRIGEGPEHDFVVDTGADRTVLAADIAQVLALPPGRTVLVHGVTGAEMTPTVKAPKLLVGGATLRPQEIPVLPRDRLGADGLLGVDVLQKRRLIMDFKSRKLEIQAAGERPQSFLGLRAALVEARESFGRLTVIDARANGALATAFVDSGGGMTIINQALAASIQKRGEWRTPGPRVQVTGVTQHVISGELRLLERLSLGSLKFKNVAVVVTDLHLFEQWGLGGKPSILLGIDVLRLFSRVELDYGRRQLLFRAGQTPPTSFG